MITVNKEILVWARKTAGLSLDNAARKLNLRDTKLVTAKQKLEEYELGIRNVSRPVLLKMSRVYKKPILTFYLKNVPIKNKKVEDFRTLPEYLSKSKDALVDALIRNIKARQSIVKSMLIDEEEAQEIDFIGICSIKDGIDTVVKIINKRIEFNLAKFRSQKDNNGPFKYLRSIIENKGIFVLLASDLGNYHSTIEPEVFRGIALPDNIAPFIIINDKDSAISWAFTLIHELVHIFIGRAGVSNNNFGDNEKEIEKFCNDITAKILFPDDLSIFKKYEHNLNGLKESISDFSTDKKISHSFIAYELYKQKIINFKTWSELRNFYHKKWKESKKQKTKNNGSPDYYIVRKFKLGNSLVNLVKRMNSSGVLTPVKAGAILGIKPANIYRLFSK